MRRTLRAIGFWVQGPFSGSRDAGFMPHLTGLRGVAVLLVVLFHLAPLSDWFGWLPGGFIGVDVFFVVSGFIITHKRFAELQRVRRDSALSGLRFVGRFYAKRIRRLVPAACCVTLVTMIAGYVLLVPIRSNEIAYSGIAQMGLVANHYHEMHSGYGSEASVTKPLLHTWSLAVEEQFFLLFPILLLVCFAFTRSKRFLLIVFAAIAGFSFWYNLRCFPSDPTRAYFFLASRGWQIVLGGIVALLPALKSGGRLPFLLGMSSLATIILFAFVFDALTWYPYWFALVPTVSAAVYLYLSRASEGLRGILSNATLVFIGEISYSIYLVHWPLICFASALTKGGIAVVAATVMATALCSALLYRFVETPQRRGGKTLRIAAGIPVVAAVCLVFVLLTEAEVADEKRRYEEEKFVLVDTKAGSVQHDDLTRLGSPDRNPTVMLWGDSHAIVIMSAVDRWLSDRDRQGVVVAGYGAQPHVGSELADAVFAYIRQNEIRLVLLTANWQPEGLADVPAVVRQIRDAGAECVVMLDVPEFDDNVWRSYHDGDRDGTTVARLDSDTRNRQPDVAAIRRAGGRVIDPRPLFLSADGLHYLGVKDGVVLFTDNNHLSKSGALHLIYPLLREQLPESD